VLASSEQYDNTLVATTYATTARIEAH
jgi:hypothetical protein